MPESSLSESLSSIAASSAMSTLQSSIISTSESSVEGSDASSQVSRFGVEDYIVLAVVLAVSSAIGNQNWYFKPEKAN